MVLRSNFKMHLTIHRSSNSRSVNTSHRLFCDKAKKALLTSNTILRIVLSELNKATGFHCLIYYLRQCSSYGLNQDIFILQIFKISRLPIPQKINPGHKSQLRSYLTYESEKNVKQEMYRAHPASSFYQIFYGEINSNYGQLHPALWLDPSSLYSVMALSPASIMAGLINLNIYSWYGLIQPLWYGLIQPLLYGLIQPLQYGLIQPLMYGLIQPLLDEQNFFLSICGLKK